MTKQIITCTGYGGTGSSAITDLLKEFDGCLSMGDEEFWFLQDYDGISDLEYFLVDGNHRSKVSLAMEKYKNYTIDNSSFYNRVFNNKFSKYTNEYLDSLIDSKFKKALSLREEQSVIKRFFYFTLSPRIQSIVKKLTFQSTYEFSPWFPIVDKTYACPSSDKFSETTKDYTKKLFSQLDIKNQYQNLIFDQLVPTNNINRYFKYVENLKVILVDRDPRDLYLLNQIHWKGASYICDTKNVDEYISWYKALRIHRKYENLNNENIIVINFEELIYEYESTITKICNFLNIDLNKHNKKKQYFNPDVSIKNTKLWKTKHIYQKEIKQIKNELSEFCYDK